ncbi:hypothetical protein GCM10017044_15560 [Kordiimonas sediminis]|uniref:RNA polymerase sigma factor 70 region 4 type 2 domain-containing protein n=1 Tax=Kordiimonas sediminis TaxID=1735581 RepID=A0A919ASA7_9PROT|nr:sigma-70 family RNA polymerase sigma factor [Kordiimonas sediminis]GHF22310.1 hypothetical protein GCM10017044_15560 [Kordiimonas sediminis]
MSRVLESFRHQKAAIRRIIAKYRPNPADIDEVEQDVFLTCFALEMKENIIEPDHLLLRVAKNLSINHAQKKINKTLTFLSEYEESPALIDERQVSAEEQMSAKQKLKIIAEALATVPEKDRRIFVMRRVEGLKATQIATRLNISVRTAERRSAAALLHCYKYLKSNGYDPVDFWIPSQKQDGAPQTDKVRVNDGRQITAITTKKT